jgi:hypothetical protein
MYTTHKEQFLFLLNTASDNHSNAVFCIHKSCMANTKQLLIFVVVKYYVFFEIRTKFLILLFLRVATSKVFVLRAAV